MKAMAATFEKILTTTLRVQIADRIRDAILKRALRPGERIIERQLAAQFGASLTVVREALIGLESEGFVIRRPNTATHVVQLTLPEVEKIFSLRRVLEAYAFEEASRRISDKQIAELEAQYVEMMDAATSKDLRRYVQKDLELHKAIWHISGNEYLEAALERIVVPLFAFSSMRFDGETTFDLLQDAQTHLPLLQVIKSRNPESAREVLLQEMDKWLEQGRDYAAKNVMG
jgi:DNA-binding GntR family transcriptional regulator